MHVKFAKQFTHYLILFQELESNKKKPMPVAIMLLLILQVSASAGHAWFLRLEVLLRGSRGQIYLEL